MGVVSETLRLGTSGTTNSAFLVFVDGPQRCEHVLRAACQPSDAALD